MSRKLSLLSRMLQFQISYGNFFEKNFVQNQVRIKYLDYSVFGGRFFLSLVFIVALIYLGRCLFGGIGGGQGANFAFRNSPQHHHPLYIEHEQEIFLARITHKLYLAKCEKFLKKAPCKKRDKIKGTFPSK